MWMLFWSDREGTGVKGELIWWYREGYRVAGGAGYMHRGLK